MKSPFLKPAPKGYPVAAIESVAAEDRLWDLRSMMPEQLRAVIAYPGSQRMVKLAAERRLRKLEKAGVKD